MLSWLKNEKRGLELGLEFRKWGLAAASMTQYSFDQIVSKYVENKSYNAKAYAWAVMVAYVLEGALAPSERERTVLVSYLERVEYGEFLMAVCRLGNTDALEVPYEMWVANAKEVRNEISECRKFSEEEVGFRELAHMTAPIIDRYMKEWAGL
jgi:hypothetical protein